MSPAAIVRALWPGIRRILKGIGRWVIRRVRRGGAQRLASRMEKRARGFQTNRRKAAERRGDERSARFRTRQIRRWLAAAAWLRRHAKKLNATTADALNKLALADRLPMTLPGEGQA